MARPLMLCLFFLFQICASVGQDNQPELVIEGNNLVVNAGSGNIVMRYASGAEASIDSVITDIQQGDKDNAVLWRELARFQNSTETKLQQLLKANDNFRSQLFQFQNESETRQERFASCHAQGGAYNVTKDGCVPLIPQCTREGETISFITGSNPYSCSGFLIDTINRLQAELKDLSRATLKTNQSGDFDTNPGVTCRGIKDKRPTAASGIYWVAQNGSASYQVYCDMLTDGGGWMLVTVVKTILPTYEKKYPVNGMNEGKLLADRTDQWASLSRTRINAVFNSYNDSILRVYSSAFHSNLGGSDTSTRPRTYYLKKLANPNMDFNVFHSIRYVPEWGVKDSGDYKLNYYREGRNHPYDPQTHDFPDAGKTMNHWENHQVTVNGKDYTTSRHGITGDVFSNCEWLFTFNQGEKLTQMNCLGNSDVYAKIWIK
eukprot:m.16851 g.16851  ORF g.16851 m.16851 type:complete len:432 (+) comp27168_c0_seq2:26-1321(+)